jgi:hypothetical protein
MARLFYLPGIWSSACGWRWLVLVTACINGAIASGLGDPVDDPPCSRLCALLRSGWDDTSDKMTESGAGPREHSPS